VISAWKLPPLIAVVAAAIVGGLYAAGPGLGLAAGALAAGSIVVSATRNRPRAPIWPAPLEDFRRHLLIVINEPLEDPEATARMVERVRIGDPQPDRPEVRVLALSRRRLFDRWRSDLERRNRQANHKLVLTLASLARVGIAATAKIGDGDAVQAVEDELRVYPATDVVLIKPGSGGGSIDEAASAALERRLECDFWCISSHSSASPRHPGPRQRSSAWSAAGISALMAIPPWPVGALIASQRPLRSTDGARDRRRTTPSS
jgi:hypothetical protein